MSSGTEQRKLAAIMSSDMVRYPDASAPQPDEGLPPDRASIPYK
jgi:hypothetical protein